MIIKRMLRIVVLATSVPPFLYVYRAYYSLVVQIVVRMFRRYSSVKSAYLRRGAGSGSVLPLISDLDFALFVENITPEDSHALQGEYKRLGKWTTILDHFLEVYDISTFHRLYEKSRRQYRFMEGKATWKLLYGRDYMSELPKRSIEEMSDGLFREARIWWTIFAWRQVQPNEYRDEIVSRNSICFKTVAETLKMEIALLHNILTYDRKEALLLSRRFLSDRETKFIDTLLWAEQHRFRRDVAGIQEETKNFLLRRVESFFDSLDDLAVGRSLTPRPPVIDCPPSELEIGNAERDHLGSLIKWIKERWGRTYRGAHLVTGIYFDLDEHALLLDVDSKNLPSLNKMRELYRIHRDGLPKRGSGVRLYLLLASAAFQVDVDYYRKGWRSVLCRTGNPDVFALLDRGDFLFDGEPYQARREIAWTPLADNFVREERDEREGRADTTMTILKRMQLALIERTARAGEPVIPLTVPAIGRAAAAETRITVLMPCRDASPSLFREALSSVFAQTSPLWNLIVIDDHSEEPGTLDLLSKLRDRGDMRVRVIESRSPMVTGALNTGMKAAKTPYVCALHCDDLLDPIAIETLDRRAGEYPEVDYFHSSRVHIDENGKQVGELHEARRSFDLEDFKSHGPVKHLHCWKVERALAIGGMDEALGPHGADDYDFPWRMAEAGRIFRAVPERLYHYREHLTHYRLTTHVPLNTQVRELKKIFAKHGLTDEEIKEQIAIRSTGYLRQALYEDEDDIPSKRA